MTQAQRKLRPNPVRDLNDQFRTSVSSSLGQWVFTRGISALGPDFVALAVGHVMGFDGFTPGDDPYGEHDFGALRIAGQHVLWKIDYYDPSLSDGSENPADPAKCHRVLTVLLASEY